MLLCHATPCHAVLFGLMEAEIIITIFKQVNAMATICLLYPIMQCVLSFHIE